MQTAAEASGEVSMEYVRVNRKRLFQMFVHGLGELNPVLSSILSPATLAELNQAASAGEDSFRYSDELWVRTVYEFAAAYHQEVISPDHVIQALAPLYRGRHTRSWSRIVTHRPKTLRKISKISA